MIRFATCLVGWFAFLLFVCHIFVSNCSALPLRIMPIGDSITAGYTDNPHWNVDFQYGYRASLFSRLTRAGIETQFVGASTEPFDDAFPGDPTRGGTYTPPIDLRALDQNGHRGYGGVAAGFVLANISDWLEADDPDVILLHIGTNGQFSDRLDQLLGTIVAARPDVQVLVAEIIPKLDFNQSIVSYNTFNRGRIAPKYEALGAKVTFVDHYTPFRNNADDPQSINRSLFATGNHPNISGYEVMAETWFQAIQGLSIPEPSSLAAWLVGLLFLAVKNHRCKRSNFLFT